jgi:hypothetical protein
MSLDKGYTIDHFRKEVRMQAYFRHHLIPQVIAFLFRYLNIMSNIIEVLIALRQGNARLFLNWEEVIY